MIFTSLILSTNFRINLIFNFVELTSNVRRNAEYCSGKCNALSHVPEYFDLYLVVIEEEAEERQDNARYEHPNGRAILNPLFCVIFHICLFFIVGDAKIKNKEIKRKIHRRKRKT